MQFKNANDVASAAYYMKLADYPRATNRALIDSLGNGLPPFSAAQVTQNNIHTNVNDLTFTRSAAAMRRNFNQAMLKPGNAFTVQCDYGPQHKRREYSQIITEEINRRIKKGFSANKYSETQRNKFAQVTLHGVAPTEWSDRDSWCPRMHSMGDVMLPSMTYRDMSNLSHFAIYRRYTAAELFRKVHGPKVAPAWNVKLADHCIQWAMKQSGQTMAPTDYAYSPERWEEAMKSNAGLSGIWNSDQIPTINVWDFYHCDPDKTDYGWRRCMILDAPSESSPATDDTKGQFLYDSNSKVYAPNLSEIIHFQYADGSVVAPFLYHSVRSLGFLLYSVCHLQNRLYCKLHDNAFESMMQYFRVSNPNDAERLTKVDLQNYGLIPDGLQMVNRNERWQADLNITQLVMTMNRGLVADSAASYSQDFGFEQDKPDKTATQITAELNATNAMVASMLQDSYSYEESSYREICRRFCRPNSKDPDVREFRKKCLSQGVPLEALDVDRWDVAAERVIGSGNKTLELNMVGQLMEIYPLLDPSAQRKVLRYKIFAATDDAALTNELQPEEAPTNTPARHDAELSAPVLMLSIPMGLKEGVSHAEYGAVLVGILGFQVKKINDAGGVSDLETIAGLENLAGQTTEGQPIEGNGAANHISILEQDETSKGLVKKLTDLLSNQMNELRGIKQRTEEASQEQTQEGQPALLPEQAAKLKGELLMAQVKAQNMAESHRQRSEQRAEIHRQNLDEKKGKNELQNADTIRQTQVKESALDIATSAEILRQNAKAEAEPKKTAGDN